MIRWLKRLRMREDALGLEMMLKDEGAWVLAGERDEGVFYLYILFHPETRTQLHYRIPRHPAMSNQLELISGRWLNDAEKAVLIPMVHAIALQNKRRRQDLTSSRIKDWVATQRRDPNDAPIHRKQGSL